MKLIIDTNRIIAALLKDGIARKIIITTDIEFYMLDYLNDEISKYKEYIIGKSGISRESIELLLELITQNLMVISEENIKAKMEEALEIMKNIDIKDAPIIACALSIPNDGIWSDDRHFDRQNKVKVWKTKDLIDFIF